MSEKTKAETRRRELEQLDDADLAELCANGNELAWSTLVRRYRRLIYAIPNRAALPDDTVEEIFHTTFSKLAESIGSIRNRDKVRSWIVTTARRLTIDAIRKRQSQRETEAPEGALEFVPDESVLPDVEVDRMENRHLVRQALLLLADKCRRMLLLLFYGEGDTRSYESIAEELGMPVGSVGPTRARCLSKLLDFYQELSPEEDENIPKKGI